MHPARKFVTVGLAFLPIGLPDKRHPPWPRSSPMSAHKRVFAANKVQIAGLQDFIELPLGKFNTLWLPEAIRLKSCGQGPIKLPLKLRPAGIGITKSQHQKNIVIDHITGELTPPSVPL